ncbi:MAG: MmcQ/YjbR family DNA-binding protein [Ilumatobacteraceae bacterium]
MELADVRTIALALPEATEEPHFDMTSFRVRGKIFATAPPDEGHLHVFVDEAETAATVVESPGWCAELWWGKKLSGVRVTLAGADPERVAELLEESYRRRAPKKLVAELDARDE